MATSGAEQTSDMKAPALTNSHPQYEMEEAERGSDFNSAHDVEIVDLTNRDSVSGKPMNRAFEVIRFAPLSMEIAKNRIEETLGRMKSTIEQINPTGALSPLAGNDELAGAKDLQAQDSPYGEMAKRKAQILAAVRAAEAKARDAEAAFKQIESRLDAEITLRLSAEAYIHEIDDNFTQQIATLEVVGMKRLEAENALDQLRARLDAEIESRSALENELFEARSQTDALSLKLVKIENQKAEAEANALTAEQAVREVEAMIQQSETVAMEAVEKFKDVESRLLQETDLRIFAELQLKTLAEQFNVNLVHDFPINEAGELTVTNPQLPVKITEAEYLRLLADLETHRHGRQEAEKISKAAEIALQALKTELTEGEERHARSAAQHESVLQELHEELRQLKIQLQLAKESSAQKTDEPPSLPKKNSEQKVSASSPPEKAADKYIKIERICYRTAIVVLVLALVMLASSKLT